MSGQKEKIIEPHYSWNSSIFTRAIVDPIKRKLGYKDENEHSVSVKESATGQELDRMKDTAKNAGKIALTGLVFGNPITAGTVMSPLITGAQTYFITEGLRDAYNRVTKPNKTALDGVVVGLDVAGAIPAIKAVENGAKYVVPEIINTSPTVLAKTASAIIPTNIKKRGIEVAMRTTDCANPIPEIVSGWQSASPQRKRKVLQYIFFGKQPNKVRGGIVQYDRDYNNLAANNLLMYTGIHNPKTARPFYDQTKPTEQQTDIIGHVIYGNDLNPQIAIEVPNDGFFTSYIASKYPKLAPRIKTYQTKVFGNTKTVPDFPKNIDVTTRGVTEDIGYNGFETINGKINVGGHMMSEGRSPSGSMYRQEHDIWKFDPGDYMKRWNTSGFLKKMGLTFINDNVTPVIFKTPIIERTPTKNFFGETIFQKQGGILKRI